MKVAVFLAFVAILASLGTALFFMLRGGGNETDKKKRMARALAFRIGLSVLLFVGILVAWAMGWVQPSGLPGK